MRRLDRLVQQWAEELSGLVRGHAPEYVAETAARRLLRHLVSRYPVVAAAEYRRLEVERLRVLGEVTRRCGR